MFDRTFANPLESATNAALAAQRFMNAPALFIVEAIMMAMQGAFQACIECSMLLTGLLGPIALGASLLPVGAKPLYAWLTGFFSLGMCKLCLNIITGLVASAIHNSGPTDTLGTAIALGLLSPLLAIALSAGGGMAVFNSLVGFFSAAGRTITMGMIKS